MKRDQLQKYLRGTVTTPDDFVQRNWCSEAKKVSLGLIHSIFFPVIVAKTST